MDKLNFLTKLCLVLAIIGALNWGLVGFFNWNLVNAIFGGPSRPDPSIVSRIIYSLVGLAGLALIALTPKLREIGSRQTSARRAEARV